MALHYVNGGVMRKNLNNHFDEYFTKPEIAKMLFETTKKIIAKYENLDKYTWLEPSVGDGCFYSLLPENRIVKEVFKALNLPLDELPGDIIHDEFDLLSNGKKIEIKTARKGLNKDTFQFNGINPKYNYDYIILLGITTESVHYCIVDKKQDYHYNHTLRKEYIKVGDKDKQLVMMNPGNQVNLKLTLNLKELKPIASFADELKRIFI